MTRTFLDSSALIAASQGQSYQADLALAILQEPERHFLTSVFVRLEVMPKAVYHQNHDEIGFYQGVFDAVEALDGADLQSVLALASEQANRHGIAAMDALHVAAAAWLEADELVTAEKPTKPLFRTDLVPVTSLHPSAADPA